jgi:Domain of unknown function (DUF4157)/Bacterial EndoU nuclease
MKEKSSESQNSSKQLESEGKSFMKAPSFALSASPADAPGEGAAAQFKKGSPGGGGGDLRGQMESSMGANFGDVKINANSSKASEMGALAFAQGNELHFAPGQFNPGTKAGQELIGHELAHVVQQREGRVQATGHEGGMAVNTDHRLEAEADAMGAKAAAQMKTATVGQQAEVASIGGGSVLQKAEDPKKPQLEAYRGAAVNKAGRVSAPADQYAIAKTTGVNVRSKPDGNLPAIGKLRYNESVHIVAKDKTGAFYFVTGSVIGWINANFVATDMPDPLATLHHITEGNLTTILQNHYVDLGRRSLITGNDFTTLAAAVIAANKGRWGVSVDWAAAQEWREKNRWRNFVDIWTADNFAIYHGSEIKAGANIWLPSASYIRILQSSGVIGSRPGWINDAVAVGKSIAGFTIGVGAGILGNLWDMLSGLWEMGKSIVSTIKGIIDGSLFSSIKQFYDEVKNMSLNDAFEMVKSLINMGKSAINDFMTSWNHPDEYKKWHFRGTLVGNILTEVVLAIVTGGGTLGAKIVAKLGKYFPKLAAIANKIIKVADKITPGGKKPNKPDVTPDKKPDFDHNDGDARDWFTTLAMAKLIAEGHDAKDTPVDVMLAQLNRTLGAKSEAVKGYRKESLGEPGRYRIVQFAKRPKTSVVDGDYTDKKKEAPFDPTKVVLLKSRKGTKLEVGNSQFGWEHIKQGHIIGKSGKSMFPRGLSESKIKKMIMDAIDNGTEVPTQKDKIKYVYRLKPHENGIAEMEVFVNRSGNFVETAYPTKGSGVWVKPAPAPVTK